jgi:hypothetical protein
MELGVLRCVPRGVPARCVVARGVPARCVVARCVGTRDVGTRDVGSRSRDRQRRISIPVIVRTADHNRFPVLPE